MKQAYGVSCNTTRFRPSGPGRGLLVLLGWVTACAQLLDLPDDPQVVQEPAGPTDEERAMTDEAAPASSVEALAGSDDRPAPNSGENMRNESETPEESESAEEGENGDADENGDAEQSGADPNTEPATANTDEVTSPSAAESSVSEGASIEPAVRFDAGVPEVEEPSARCRRTQSLGPDGRCYIAEQTRLSWARARTNCRQQGAGWDLVSIRDEAVNRFMAELVSVEAWIGASDAQNEGNWAWVDDGTRFWNGTGVSGRRLNGAFENWDGDNEPNGGATSDCARLQLTQVRGDIGVTWADLECDELRASVCEGPAL